MVIGLRQRIVEETDGSASQIGDDMDEDDEEAASRAVKLRKPSMDAVAKFEDYGQFCPSTSLTDIQSNHSHPLRQRRACDFGVEEPSFEACFSINQVLRR